MEKMNICFKCGKLITDSCPFNITDKISLERSEMQTLLMIIRKKTREKMPEISDMIKYYFNSKYGEMGEGIMSSATLSKKIIEEFISRSTVDNNSDYDIDNSSFQSILNKSKSIFGKTVLEHASIYKHAIYQDTDSIMFNLIELDDVLDEIIKYSIKKNIILVTGDRGVGKTNSVITLIEKWKNRDKIDSVLNISDTEVWTVYHKQRSYDIHTIPSLDFNNQDIYKQTCLIINVVSIDFETKKMKAILYWLSKRINNTDIIMVSQVNIPFCSTEGYEDYKEKKLTYLDRFQDSQRSMFREFFKKLTKTSDFLVLLDEFGNECQKRGIMKLPFESYESDSVGGNLAILLAVLAELDFDMRMWNTIVDWKAEKDASKD